MAGRSAGSIAGLSPPGNVAESKLPRSNGEGSGGQRAPVFTGCPSHWLQCGLVSDRVSMNGACDRAPRNDRARAHR